MTPIGHVVSPALLAFLCFAFSGAAAPPAARPAPTGLELFTRNPRFIDARLSPDGKVLAALMQEGPVRTLVLLDLQSRKLLWRLNPVDLSPYRKGSEMAVGDFIWLNNKRLVAHLWDRFNDRAAPIDQGQALAVNIDGTEARTFGVRVLSRVPKDERRAFALGVDYVGGREVFRAVLYKLDLVDGRSERIVQSPIPGEVRFVLDETGQPRAVQGIDESLRSKSYLLDAAGKWVDLGEVKGFSARSVPLEFSQQSRTLAVAEPAPEGFAVYAVAVDSGKRTLLSRNDLVPPASFISDFVTHQLLALHYYRDVSRWDLVAPEHPVARLLAGLLDSYPEEDARLLSFDESGTKSVVRVFSDRDPGRFLLLSAATRSAEELFQARPWIKPEEMAQTAAFHVPASDGTLIHGYLTRPRGSEGAAPMVVIPHDGPIARDEWGFDPEAQLFASQGFAVLRVNYRGSAGYGDEYQEAGYQHWSDRMMLDVVDAARYAVRKGFADEKRICVYGAGSFGGYAAMQAAIIAPDLFRCAIGVSGIYDLTPLFSHRADPMDFMNNSPAGAWRGFARKVIGADEATLKAASPLYNLDKLRAHVMLVHGRQDRRAPYAAAIQFRDAIAAKGIEPAWIEEKAESHGFYDEDARLRMYTQMVAFLRTNTAAAAKAP